MAAWVCWSCARLNSTIDVVSRVYGAESLDTPFAIDSLAINLSEQGRYGEAEKLFREGIETAGKAGQPGLLGSAWYNFACGAAVAGRRDEAFTYLGQAVDHGYVQPDAMAVDPDLKSLHGDPRFEALLAKARQKTAAPKQ
jgi:eukaryotic-like serine/threonine-protein kinase